MKQKPFLALVSETAEGSRLPLMADFVQHGNTSCLQHCLAVAYVCYAASEKMSFLRFRQRDLVRGALLHDYFLYDWHIPDKTHRLHGFRHPAVACRNAEEDFSLTAAERDIIQKHMFPLTLMPPSCRESLLVSLADKVCSLYETMRKNPYQSEIMRNALQAVNTKKT